MASHVAEALEERKSEEAVLRLPLLSPPTAAAILEPPSTVEPWSPPSAFETSQPPSRTWKQPFCACGGDLLTCALGYCAPMVLFGMNQVEMADGDSRRFFPACCAYSCIPAGFVLSSLVAGPAVAVVAQMPPDVAVATTYGMVYACALVGQVALAGYASRQRGRMRKQEGLPPARCADFWQWCCCPACAVCQEGAQMQARKEERMQRQLSEQAALAPPAAQRMLH